MAGRDWDRTFPSYEEFIRHAYAPYTRTLSTAGPRGVVLLEAHEPSGDFSDAPVPELVIAYQHGSVATGLMDFGAGRFNAPRGCEFSLTAPNSGSSIWMDAPHVVRAVAIPYSYLLDLTGDEVSNFPQDGDFGHLHAKAVREPRVIQVCDALFDGLEQGTALGGLYVDGALLQIASLLLERRKVTPTGTKGQLANWQINRVTDYMAANLSHELNLADLAALINLSPYHFCRAFRRSVGIPPHAWLTAKRMTAAKMLLDRPGPFSMSDIAAKLGYSSNVSFANAFRRFTGQTPSQWRAAIRSGARDPAGREELSSGATKAPEPTRTSGHGFASTTGPKAGGEPRLVVRPDKGSM